MSETPGELRWAGRPLGADNRMWLVDELGLTDADLARLSAEGVI